MFFSSNTVVFYFHLPGKKQVKNQVILSTVKGRPEIMFIKPIIGFENLGSYYFKCSVVSLVNVGK